jgi:hypothetical protein
LLIALRLDRDPSGEVGQRSHIVTIFTTLWDQAVQIADRLTQSYNVPTHPSFEDGVLSDGSGRADEFIISGGANLAGNLCSCV